MLQFGVLRITMRMHEFSSLQLELLTLEKYLWEEN